MVQFSSWVCFSNNLLISLYDLCLFSTNDNIWFIMFGIIFLFSFLHSVSKLSLDFDFRLLLITFSFSIYFKFKSFYFKFVDFLHPELTNFLFLDFLVSTGVIVLLFSLLVYVDNWILSTTIDWLSFSSHLYSIYQIFIA